MPIRAICGIVLANLTKLYASQLRCQFYDSFLRGINTLGLLKDDYTIGRYKKRVFSSKVVSTHFPKGNIYHTNVCT